MLRKSWINLTPSFKPNRLLLGSVKKALFALLIAVSPSWGVITHVGTCQNSDTSGSNFASISCTLSATTAGNALVFACGWGTNDQVPTGSDGGDTFAAATNAKIFNGNNQGLAIVYASNITAGKTTMTCNYSPSSNFVSIMAHEYSGLATTSMFNIGNARSNAAVGTGANANATAAMTTTTDGDLIYINTLETSTGSGDTCAAGTNSLTFTERQDQCSAFGQDAADAVQATQGSVTGSFTISPGARTWDIAMAAFRPAAVTATGGSFLGVNILGTLNNQGNLNLL